METRSKKKARGGVSPVRQQVNRDEFEARETAAREFLEDMVPGCSLPKGSSSSDNFYAALRDGSLILRAAVEVEERLFGDSIIKSKVKTGGSAGSTATPGKIMRAGMENIAS